MDLSQLKGDPLLKTYQGLMGALTGNDPSKFPVPNLTQDQLRQDIDKFLTRFDQGMSFDPNLRDPRAPIVAIMDKVAKGQPLTSPAEIQLFNSFVAMSGNTGREGVAFDDTISDQERKIAGEIRDRMNDGGTVISYRTDAEKALADAEAAKLEAARLEAARAAEVHATEQAGLTQQFGLRALGFTGTQAENQIAFVTLHQNALRGNSMIIFGKDITNPADMVEAMKGDTAAANRAIQFVARGGDYKLALLADLQSGDPDRIREAQALINLSGEKVEITGVFNQATKDAAGSVLSQRQGLILEDGTSPYLDFTYSKQYQEFLREKGVEDSPAVKAQFSEAHPDTFANQISGGAIVSGVTHGTFPVDMDIIRQQNPELAARLDAMPGDEFAQVRGIYVAEYLADEANFRKYDAALKERDPAALRAELDKIEVTAPAAPREVVVATRETVAEHRALTEFNADTLPGLKRDQIALSDQLDKSGFSNTWNAIYDRITPDTTLGDNAPPEAKRFLELRQAEEAAMTNRRSYIGSPLSLNTGDKEAIKAQYGVDDPLHVEGAKPVDIRVIGGVGAPYSPITTRFEIQEYMAQNGHMQYFMNLPPERRAAVMKYMEDPANFRDVTPDPAGERRGPLVSEFDPARLGTGLPVEERKIAGVAPVLHGVAGPG